LADAVRGEAKHMIKRILVGLGDVQHSANAVRQAIDLCQRHDAELTAVTVVDHRGLDNVGPVPIGGGAAAQELRDYRYKLTRDVIERAVSQCEDECNDAGIRFRLVYEEGKPLDTICHAARYHDLMILGNDENLFDHGVIDEPSDELVRLVHEGVRPILALPRTTTRFERALIAYSGSMESAKTMKHFVQMRLWPDIKIRISMFGRSEEKAEAELAEAAKYCNAHGLEVDTEYAPGSPKELLLPFADKWEADVLVVGNSAKNLLLRKLFGETALHVIRQADRAVFMSQ
jgi:nucleotide-binding universal stress UspA family protein